MGPQPSSGRGGGQSPQDIGDGSKGIDFEKKLGFHPQFGKHIQALGLEAECERAYGRS